MHRGFYTGICVDKNYYYFLFYPKKGNNRILVENIIFFHLVLNGISTAIRF